MAAICVSPGCDSHGRDDVHAVGDDLRLGGERRLYGTGRPRRELQERGVGVAPRRVCCVRSTAAAPGARLTPAAPRARGPASRTASGISKAAAPNRSASAPISDGVVPASTGIIATSSARHASRRAMAADALPAADTTSWPAPRPDRAMHRHSAGAHPRRRRPSARPRGRASGSSDAAGCRGGGRANRASSSLMPTPLPPPPCE